MICKAFVSLFFLLGCVCGCSQTTSSDIYEDDHFSELPNEDHSSSSGWLSSSSFSADNVISLVIYSAVDENGIYTTRDSVAAYLCKFEKLPSSYVTKNEGIALYEEKEISFSKWNFNPWEELGVMIGGDIFNNREELLPQDYRPLQKFYPT